MYKFVALFAVLAVAATQIAPMAYIAGAWPYSTGAWPYSAGAWPYNVGVMPYTADAWPYNYGVHSAIATQYPNTPALALDPVNKVPLDTPEVAAAKVSHFQAKALAEAHVMKKRSVVTPLAYNTAFPYATPYSYNSAWASPYTSLYSAGLGYSGFYPYHY